MLNVENCWMDTKSKNIAQTLELFKAAGENYWDGAAVERISF